MPKWNALAVGLGEDEAEVQVGGGWQFFVLIDMVVEKVTHFPEDAQPTNWKIKRMLVHVRTAYCFFLMKISLNLRLHKSLQKCKQYIAFCKAFLENYSAIS